MCTGGGGSSATSPRYLDQLRIQDPLGETSVGSSPAQVKLWDFDYTVKKISPTPDIRGKTPIQADLVSFFYYLFFRRKTRIYHPEEHSETNNRVRITFVIHVSLSL
jgi:hypothetical protein